MSLWIRNLVVYGLAGDHQLTAEGIAEALASKKFVPAGKMDLASIGWVAPAKHRPDELAIAAQDAVLVCLRVESKLLPATVINQEADRRAEKLETEENRKVGRRELRELRERVSSELIGQAFSTESHQRAVIDLKNNLVMVEASSSNRSESLLSHLREALGDFPTRLLDTKCSPRSAMTLWLNDAAPENFTLDADCKMEFPGDGGAVVTFAKQNLGTTEVKAFVGQGYQVGKIGLSWAEKISFMVNEKLEFKKLTMLGLLMDEIKYEDAKDQAAAFDAEFALFIGSMRQFVPAVLNAFGGEMGDLFDAQATSSASVAEEKPEAQPELPWAGPVDQDPLYETAVEVVTGDQRGSISFLQRKLQIGYNRAARLLEQMELAGVVTSMQQDGSRKVLAA